MELKIVHHMQCRTSQICTCVASSSVIATITLNRAIYMPTHTDMHRSARAFIAHARTYRIRKMSNDTEMLKRQHNVKNDVKEDIITITGYCYLKKRKIVIK